MTDKENDDELDNELDEDELDELQDDDEDEDEEDDSSDEREGSKDDDDGVDSKTKRNRERRQLAKQKRRSAIAGARRLEEEHEKLQRNLADERSARQLAEKESQKLRKVLENVDGRFNNLEAGELEREINDSKTRLDAAEEEFASAVSSSDEKLIIKALRDRDSARDRYRQAAYRKDQLARRSRSEAEDADDDSAPAFDTEREGFYKSRWVKENDWYTGGYDDASLATREVNQALLKAGYRPDSHEFWDELTKRTKTLASAKKSGDDKGKSRQVVGGRSSISNLRKSDETDMVADKKFLVNLRAAGFEKGTKEYKAAINEYKRIKRG